MINTCDLHYAYLSCANVDTYQGLHRVTFLLSARNRTPKARRRASGVASAASAAIDASGVLGRGSGAATLSAMIYTSP
jgi:hypothetical protein